jgi:peptidoglycan LD-endopeptidase CwlK
MPNVPYQPVPDVQPLPGTGSQGVSINAPGAAFGTTVASAIKSVGGDISQGSNELFGRAEAIQQLQNETTAKEADAQYTMQAGTMHEQYLTTQGKAATQGLDAHNQDLYALRQKIREGLPNDMSRRMFDSQSLGFMARNVFAAGGHAASETKRWAMNASKARVDAAKDDTLANPNSDIAFQANLNKTMNEIDEQGGVGLGGWDADQIAHEKSQATSALYSQRIVGMARTDPFRAKAMMEEAFDKHLIRGQDMPAVQKQVFGQLASVGSRNVSDAVNAGYAPYMHQRDIDKFNGVEESLTNIFKQAQRDHPELTFSISSGRRTQEEQDRLFAQGRTAPGPIVTQTRDSNHITGRAIDIQPMGGTSSAQVEAAMKEASAKLGIPLGPEHDQIKGWDPNHYSLPREYDVASAPKVAPEPLQSRIDRARAYTSKLDGMEDTGLTDATRSRVEGDFTHAQAIKRDFDYTNNQTIAGALVGGVDGKIPTTKEELVSLSPEIAKAWDQLDHTKQLEWLTKLAANSKRDVGWSEQSLRRYQSLKAMADDPNGIQDFLNTDIVAEKNMPNSAKLQLINFQQQRMKVATSDPKVAQAMSSLGGELTSAGIDRTDKERYYQFRGALSGAMQAFQETNKKPPSDEQVHDIGTRLLQEMHQHWWQQSQLRFEVPDDIAEEIKADPAWKRAGIEPSPDQIARVYARRQFQELYGGKAKAATAETQVPVSR